MPRKVWLHTSVVMPAILARRRTIFQALMRSSRSPVSSACPRPYVGHYLDLAGATLFPLGYLLHARRAGPANLSLLPFPLDDQYTNGE